MRYLREGKVRKQNDKKVGVRHKKQKKKKKQGEKKRNHLFKILKMIRNDDGRRRLVYIIRIIMINH